MAKPLAGIILAAGGSRRMGRPKQSLPWGDTTLLGQVVGEAEASSLDDIVIVVGRVGEKPAKPLRSRWVVNPTPEAGSVSSLLRGVEAVGGRPVMVLLGDMAAVEAEVIDTVLMAWNERPRWAALTVYREGEGHPLVLSEALLAELAGSEGDKVLWPLLHDEAKGEVLLVEVDRPLPVDINTWDDYEAALEQYRYNFPD